MTDYYNENDPKAAAWLRELILQGHIPQGVVDERSIEDIYPNDLKSYRRCHFFAGIGGWAYALRLAAWPDDRRVWTGSCPCQPYSAAGKGKGAADERHLWPHWFHLISECQPGVIFGEQVASKAALGWWDSVRTDLEIAHYACWAADLCAAGVGAAHIRQRLYFVAHHDTDRRIAQSKRQLHDTEYHAEPRCEVGELADGNNEGLEVVGLEQTRRQRTAVERGGAACGLVHPNERVGQQRRPDVQGWADRGDAQSRPGLGGAGMSGPWSSVEWIWCRDEKWRPVEPQAQCMANGVSLAMVRLCAADEKELVNAAEADGVGAEIVRALLLGHVPEAIWRSLGRRYGISQATVLLAVVCKHAGELGRLFNGTSSRGPQVGGAEVQPLPETWSTAGAPQGRECAEQPTDKLGDALRKLPQESSSFRQLVSALASFNGSPLVDRAPARVERLRGYGNAIVPQVAAQMIGAYMDHAGILEQLG